ncbi:MAG: hypothetical protein HQL25_07730 [Candidatus Omnitrophica bacterium]|nr:hypothetical protein [Candidatus Omnitrophota bacterium]
MRRYFIQMLVILGILSLLALQYFLSKKTAQQDARVFAEKILDSWQNGNFQDTLQYWQDTNQTPPIDKINAYEITDIKHDKRYKKHFATVAVTFDLPKNSPIYGHNKWILELSENKTGWIIAGCYEQK